MLRTFKFKPNFGVECRFLIFLTPHTQIICHQSQITKQKLSPLCENFPTLMVTLGIKTCKSALKSFLQPEVATLYCQWHKVQWQLGNSAHFYFYCYFFQFIPCKLGSLCNQSTLETLYSIHVFGKSHFSTQNLKNTLKEWTLFCLLGKNEQHSSLWLLVYCLSIYSPARCLFANLQTTVNFLDSGVKLADSFHFFL